MWKNQSLVDQVRVLFSFYIKQIAFWFDKINQTESNSKYYILELGRTTIKHQKIELVSIQSKFVARNSQ